jgi:hypothetical protein
METCVPCSEATRRVNNAPGRLDISQNLYESTDYSSSPCAMHARLLSYLRRAVLHRFGPYNATACSQ